jgi:RND family efflux transporter MFP subunit
MKKTASFFGRALSRFPLVIFLLALLGLFVAIYGMNQLRAPQAQEEEEGAQDPRIVDVYTMDETPYIQVSGEVEKEHVIQITAQTGGVVQKLLSIEGDEVTEGETLLTLSDTYGGSIAATVTRRIALRQEQNALETFDKEISIYDDRRDEVSGSGTEEEIARKQETLNKRNLEARTDIAQLEADRAAIQESLYFPGAPFDGTVQDVLVSRGQSVSPGEPLMLFKGDQDATVIRVLLPKQFVQALDVAEPTIVKSNGEEFSLFPYYISEVATDGQLYEVLYSVPETESYKFTNTEFLLMDIPIMSLQEQSTLLVPIDAVHITRDGAYIYVVGPEEDVAVSKEVILGTVYGEYVAINEGISSSDVVILNRAVVDGERIARTTATQE